mmetsp:Transcript_40771/g.64166  ORF Transcript_40771/g.64166 Transcript_40771/m.64166 type:complete len:89 (+) Transcript_40771:330-596(+)
MSLGIQNLQVTMWPLALESPSQVYSEYHLLISLPRKVKHVQSLILIMEIPLSSHKKLPRQRMVSARRSERKAGWVSISIALRLQNVLD